VGVLGEMFWKVVQNFVLWKVGLHHAPKSRHVSVKAKIKKGHRCLVILLENARQRSAFHTIFYSAAADT